VTESGEAVPGKWQKAEGEKQRAEL